LVAKSRRLKQATVVARAAELANELGDGRRLTLSMLAQDLGVRVPSLYNHVDGLEGLRRELALEGLHQMARQLRQAAVGKSGREAMLAVAGAYRRFAHEQPGVYPLTIQAPRPDDEAWQALSAEIVELMMLVLAAYQLDGDQALHVIRGFRALLHGYVSLEAGGGFDLPLSREESFHLLIETYLEGLAGDKYSALPN
jgi:AcrR family transcriptional regulator